MCGKVHVDMKRGLLETLAARVVGVAWRIFKWLPLVEEGGGGVSVCPLKLLWLSSDPIEVVVVVVVVVLEIEKKYL